MRLSLVASAWATRSSAVATASRARWIRASRRLATAAVALSAPRSAAASQRAANSASASPGRLKSFSSGFVRSVTVRGARRWSTSPRCTPVKSAFVFTAASGSR